MKQRKTYVRSLAAGLLLTMGAQFGYAESDVSIGSPAVARLDFQISIPAILFLQVGSSGGNVDVVNFPLSDLPGTGPVVADSGAVTVRAAGLVPNGSTMTLSADSSTPLTDGSTDIPFTDISWTGSGDLSGGVFNGGPLLQPLQTWNGSGDRNGTYTFSYANNLFRDAGTYKGQVTYTLSAP